MNQASTKNATKIGLVGTTRGYGLAHQNHDIAVRLEIRRWLTADRSPVAAGCPCRIDCVPRSMSAQELAVWLGDLDAVLFVERPTFENLPDVAQSLGVSVVCVPNWEWLHPNLAWLAHVDMMLCPTRHTATLLNSWKARFGFAWAVRYVPWPIDTDHFTFRQRGICRRFVYVHGSGGALAIGRESQIAFYRKGLGVLLAAAERAPEISLIVYAFPDQVPPVLPANVELRCPPTVNRWLYSDGDVCIQPSLWEGLGLPLLECQAAGMPLITTDAPPMNEHRPIYAIKAELEDARLTDTITIPAARMLPDDLAAGLRSVHGRRMDRLSRQARRYVEREHSWRAVGPQLRAFIDEAVHGRDRQSRAAQPRPSHAT